MLTSLPTPSAPRAALVKLVAMEKKYTVPSSLHDRIEAISVFSMFTQLITTSHSLPSVSSMILLYMPTASAASMWKYSSARSSALALSSDFCDPAAQITLPVTPTLFFASYRQRSPDLPPPPITRTVSPGFESLAACAGAPATSSADSASPSGMSSGSLA